MRNDLQWISPRTGIYGNPLSPSHKRRSHIPAFALCKRKHRPTPVSYTHLNANKVSVNTACIKKLPDTDYVQILVNSEEKKLAVRPCLEDEKDAMRWCSATEKRSPRQISCRIFFGKVISLMDWNPHYRYKLLGKLIRSNNELLFVFDLTTPEIFIRTLKDDGKMKSSRCV